MHSYKQEGEDSMSLQYDHQHLRDLLGATHAAALEFLESLATRPAGHTPRALPHDVLPEEGLGAQQLAQGGWTGFAYPHFLCREACHAGGVCQLVNG
jgi:hypothetical protein